MDPEFRALIRAGDEGAFAVLFRRHGTAVYNHCFRLTGDWTAAEDCASFTFLEAWRLRAKADPWGGSLLPWLLGIATNVVHHRRRTARRHQRLLARLPAPELVPDFADEVVGRLEDQERVTEVLRVLDELPRADREVLALCVWAGLDYNAAARALGVPVGTVRSRLSRARRRLDRLAGGKPLPGREPPPVRRQMTDDRGSAVRPTGGQQR
ncbi:RNA polymerase sigma factor [Actinacidiphila acidipaludis]|uniref:RNA polymerase sigma factor n=1 Tax=Actinacidiphila acidipaludis TaxID=2873382 RepID=A0ABS7PZ55_9ACTN|nr:RNA polymerase sigma factor [Streptomyces acidipaludis]MBY8876126.1 RNA polymerase sigma factor [Streptomyces acidipaludis]